MTYFKKRVQLYNLPTTTTVRKGGNGDNGIDVPFDILKEHELGIQINYTWHGSVLHYESRGNKWKKEYYRICLSTEVRNQPKYKDTGQRYWQPWQSPVMLFCTPAINAALVAKTQIDTLYLVEGELKALAAYNYSILPYKLPAKYKELKPLHIMGMPSINGYKEKGIKKIHWQIEQIINTCNPKRIVIVHDADFRKMPRWDPNDDNLKWKDLGKRSWDFYKSVIELKELLSDTVTEIYYCHINESYNEVEVPGIEPNTTGYAKGLDDLFLTEKNKEYQIITELQNLVDGKYFKFQSLTTTTQNQIQKYFYINSVGAPPTDFYNANALIIKDSQFKYRGSIFRYNPEKGQVEYKKHQDAENYIRIGTKFVKIVYKQEANSIYPIRQLQDWTASAIKQDYPSLHNEFVTKWIEKYDVVCNIPDNNPETYQQMIVVERHGTISKNYNLYYKIEHMPEPGTWDKTREYLEHLFGNKLDVALDWLYLTWNRPTVKVPAIALVSKEKNTGKSTFIFWLELLFQQNAIIISNDDLNSNWNDDYAAKKIIAVDEGFIEKKIVAEKLKSWITNRKINLNAKFAGRTPIDWFATLVLCSNDEDNFVRIDDDEYRYFVNKVPVIPEDKRNPELLSQMNDEIPYFVHYIQNEHKMTYPIMKNRLWFENSVLETDALAAVKKQSKSGLQKEINLILEDIFWEYHSYQTPQQLMPLALYYTSQELMELIKIRNGGVLKYQQNYVSEVLRKDFGFTPPKNYRPNMYPTLDNDPANDNNKIITIKKGPSKRYYQFLIQEVIPLTDLTADFNITPEMLKDYQHRIGEDTTKPIEDLPF